jgi:hypothetical protein
MVNMGLVLARVSIQTKLHESVPTKATVLVSMDIIQLQMGSFLRRGEESSVYERILHYN